MSNEQSTEAMIQERGLSAPRLSPADIDMAIKDERFYILEDTMHTVCVLTLQNGYTVTGESACVDPRNFNKEVGEKVARENARQKVWPLEGYLLKQRLFERDNMVNAKNAPIAATPSGQQFR